MIQSLNLTQSFDSCQTKWSPRSRLQCPVVPTPVHPRASHLTPWARSQTFPPHKLPIHQLPTSFLKERYVKTFILLRFIQWNYADLILLLYCWQFQLCGTACAIHKDSIINSALWYQRKPSTNHLSANYGTHLWRPGMSMLTFFKFILLKQTDLIYYYFLLLFVWYWPCKFCATNVYAQISTNPPSSIVTSNLKPPTYSPTEGIIFEGQVSIISWSIRETQQSVPKLELAHLTNNDNTGPYIWTRSGHRLESAFQLDIHLCEPGNSPSNHSESNSSNPLPLG